MCAADGAAVRILSVCLDKTRPFMYNINNQSEEAKGAAVSARSVYFCIRPFERDGAVRCAAGDLCESGKRIS